MNADDRIISQPIDTFVTVRPEGITTAPTSPKRYRHANGYLAMGCLAYLALSACVLTVVTIPRIALGDGTQWAFLGAGLGMALLWAWIVAAAWQASLYVDAAGMRTGPWWAGLFLRVRWGAIVSWTIKPSKRTVYDEHGGASYEVADGFQLEIAVNERRVRRVVMHDKAAFYPEIVAELRARLPEKETALQPTA
jgi:hypothetical protein